MLPVLHLPMYHHRFTSQEKSQKQTGDSGSVEKYRTKHLRFPSDLGMLKANMISNVTEPRLWELDQHGITSSNLGEAWDGDETS
jgi:hypothetical protein